MQCIVNNITKVVREWGNGVYKVQPVLSKDEAIMDFKTLPSPKNYDKVLKYENGDIVATAEVIPKPLTMAEEIAYLKVELAKLKAV